MKIVGDNIISFLGFTAVENHEAVKKGKTGLRPYELWNLSEPFVASLIDREYLKDAFAAVKPLSDKRYTSFEQSMILSVHEANKNANIDLASPRVLFIVSTTKGNVNLLDENEKGFDKKHLYLWYSANLVAQFFSNSNIPVVVSNACISGGCAQIVARRALQTGKYDYAVVVGADLLCRFIVSGFQSFKALSPELCKPFDKEHKGLNLGEAAATIIYSTITNSQFPQTIQLVDGVICNDATHISAPSRTGDGSFLAINQLITKYSLSDSEISFINAHGTATSYNDDMEMTAIARSGLTNVPVNSLKGCFGHTLGAAGILESIISARALQEGIVVASQGFEESDHINFPNITTENIKRDQLYAIKMMSGFGGTNAVLLFKNIALSSNVLSEKVTLQSSKNSCDDLFITNHCKITGSLSEYYFSLKIEYPKFFKMDNLSKAGFLAAEILLQNHENKSETAIICFTGAASLNTDKAYQKTIQYEDEFFPSPSLFVYTLPNIVTGEIAIRNGSKTETSCYVSENANAEMIMEVVTKTFNDSPNLKQALVGWLNDDDFCMANMMLVERNGNRPFTKEHIISIFNNN
jgi:3-oxoacyl-[acyl-carrier-protein] synthase-1